MLNFSQLISLSLPVLSDLVLEGQNWQTRAGWQEERFKKQSRDWKLGGYHIYKISKQVLINLLYNFLDESF